MTKQKTILPLGAGGGKTAQARQRAYADAVNRGVGVLQYVMGPHGVETRHVPPAAFRSDEEQS